MSPTSLCTIIREIIRITVLKLTKNIEEVRNLNFSVKLMQEITFSVYTTV